MTNLQEKFLPIKGLENLYEISNLGTVRSIKRLIVFSDGRKRIYHPAIVKIRVSVAGYKVAPVVYNRKSHHLFIHRLIAIHFIPNPDNKPFINHIDCNKQNNSIENLEWCTHAENTSHAVNNKLFKRGEQHFNTKLTEHNVLEIKTSNLLGSQLADKFNISRSTVSEIKNGNNWAWLNP